MSSEQTIKSLRKEGRRLIKNLSRRIDRIEKLGGAQASQFSVDKYKELEKTMPRYLKDLNKEELQTLVRDLKYINTLKTSTVEGAKRAKTRYEPLKEQLSSLSKDKQNDFWKIYDRLYETNAGMADFFKYEIFETITDYMFKGQDTDQTVTSIINEYNKTLERLGSEADDKTVKVLFTKNLEKLRE